MIDHENTELYQIAVLTRLVSQSLDTLELNAPVSRQDKVIFRHGAMLLNRISSGSRFIEEIPSPKGLTPSPEAISLYSPVLHVFRSLRTPVERNISPEIEGLYKTILALSRGKFDEGDNVQTLKSFFHDFSSIFQKELRNKLYHKDKKQFGFLSTSK